MKTKGHVYVEPHFTKSGYFDNKSLVLVDFENVQTVDIEQFNRHHLTFFIGANQSKDQLRKISVPVGTEYTIIKLDESGPDMLDNIIKCYVALLITLHKPLEIVVLSKDKGYDGFLNSFNGKGCKLSRTVCTQKLDKVEDAKTEILDKPLFLDDAITRLQLEQTAQEKESTICRVLAEVSAKKLGIKKQDLMAYIKSRVSDLETANSVYQMVMASDQIRKSKKRIYIK